MQSFGMVYLDHLRMGGIEYIGGQAVDAWQFNPNAVGQHLMCVPLNVGDTVEFEGDYTGLTPYQDRTEGGREAPYVPGQSFKVTVSLIGPAKPLGDKS